VVASTDLVGDSVVGGDVLIIFGFPRLRVRVQAEKEDKNHGISAD